MFHFKLAATAMALLVLGSCYIPLRFDAEIAIVRDGTYTLTYNGTLTHAVLVPEFQSKPLTAAEAAERARGIQADLERDPAFKEVEFLGNGLFRIAYFTTGNIYETTSVTFVRTDSNILSISYVRETGQITVRGALIPEAQKNMVIDAGLNSVGEIRVITDARVLEHNATGVVPAEAGNEYVWIVRDINAQPLLLIIG